MIKRYIFTLIITAFSLQAQVVYRSPEPITAEVCVGDICAIREPYEPALPIDLDAEEVEVLEPIATTEVEVIEPIVTRKILPPPVPKVLSSEPKKIKTFEGKIVKPDPIETKKNIAIDSSTQPVAQPEIEITEAPDETIISIPEIVEKVDVTSTKDDLEDPVKIPDNQDIQVL